MRHTSYFDAETQLLKIQDKELKLALEAHNNKYEFPDNDLGPYVDVPGLKVNNPHCIKSIKLEEDGNYTVTAVPENNPKETPVEVPFSHLNPLTIDYIIDYMDDVPGGPDIKQQVKPEPDIIIIVMRLLRNLEDNMEQNRFDDLVIKISSKISERIEELGFRKNDDDYKVLITTWFDDLLEDYRKKSMQKAEDTLNEILKKLSNPID